MTRVCQARRARWRSSSSPPRAASRSKAFYGWYFRNVLPRIGQTVMRNNSAAYEYLPESVGQFYEYEQLTERMEAAGLTDVSVLADDVWASRRSTLGRKRNHAESGNASVTFDSSCPPYPFWFNHDE